MTTTTTNTTTTTSISLSPSRSPAPIKRYNFRERCPVVTGVEQRQRDQQQRDQGKGQGHDRGRGRTQGRGRLPPSLLGNIVSVSTQTRAQPQVQVQTQAKGRDVLCTGSAMSTRTRGQSLIGFCFVCSFISVVVVSSLPVRYWDPDWGFVNGSGFVCVACFVFPNLSASAFSLPCSPSILLPPPFALRSPSSVHHPSSVFHPRSYIPSSLHQLPNPSVPYRKKTPFIYSVHSPPPPSTSVSSLRLHLRSRHRIHPLYPGLSPHPPTHFWFRFCFRSFVA
ncbi:hypothetical protein C8J55DRAFT_503075 [Lentinula edodes]|uniref:Uncharacterized protein n=1 Tax=Lentinula lateritia TaxID=40482 RepID=A0A9W9AWK2_9AGAR|nr:hypothetical protein C8J55DRAFT_503075 [Lentinula edodes]